MKNIPLLPTSHQPQKYAGPSADEVLALRKQFMNPDWPAGWANREPTIAQGFPNRAGRWPGDFR